MKVKLCFTYCNFNCFSFTIALEVQPINRDYLFFPHPYTNPQYGEYVPQLLEKESLERGYKHVSPENISNFTIFVDFDAIA